MAEESEDLYGDIDDSPVFPTFAAAASVTSQHGASASTHVSSSATASSSRPRSLVEEVQYLQEKVAKLEQENEILKRNMGILYRTATAEIQRKDNDILRLTKASSSQP